MPVRSIILPLLVAALPAAAAAQSPSDLVNRAVAAMGGEAALRGINGVQADFQQETFSVGQSEQPESPARATILYGKAWHDYRGGRRALLTESRALTGVVTRGRLSIRASAGVNEAGGNQAPAAPGLRATQLRLMRLWPDRLLLTMAANPGTLSALSARNLRGQPANGIHVTGEDTVNVWFDRVTGLPLGVETITDDPILGDRSTMFWLTRWQNSGAVKLPRQLDVTVNGELQSQVYFNTITLNPPLPDSVFNIPDSIAARSQPAPPAAPAVTVTMNQLSPTVFRAEGGNYNTLIVEQPDQVVLVEAALSTQRMRAVLDSVRARFPGKRIGAAVMTHYHWDHSGGIREVIAEGIPIITMEQNAGFVRQVASARRTTQPDLQAQRRRTPTIRTFTDSMVIGSGETAVVLYRMPSVHAEGLLAAWAPSARALFTSDVVNPGPQGQVPQAGSAELVALARDRGLAPEKYAGGHGVLVNWTDIERAASTP